MRDQNKQLPPYPEIFSRTSFQLFLIVLLGALIYCNTFHTPFIFDDETSITGNPVLRHLGTFLAGDGYAYNPRRFVGYLTFAVNYHFGALEVAGYHLVNLAIHLASAVLLYFLARVTLAVSEDKEVAGEGPRWLPLFTALLFVAHPVQTQAVTYIVQRLASLCAMFYLAALLAYAQGRIMQLRERIGAAFACYGTAALMTLLAARTKENAATIPLLLLAYELSFFGGNKRKKIAAASLLALVVVAGGLLAASHGRPLGEVLAQFDSMSRETTTISRWSYLITEICVIATYLRLLILPVGQSLDYDYPVYHSLLQPRPLLSLLLLCALAGLSAFLYSRSAKGDGEGGAKGSLRVAAFGVVWFFVTLLVESSVIPIRDVIYEHRLYLPSAGLFLAFAALLPVCAGRAPKRLAAGLSCLLIMALSVAAYARNEVWRTDISLWADAEEKAPAKARPHHNLARAYKSRGMVREAEREYLVALRLDPTNSDSYTNLGVIYRMEGRLAEAVEMHRKAMEAGAANPAPRLNLGVVLASQGKYVEAEALFREALRLDPNYADAHLNLGHLYRITGEFQKADDEYRTALTLDPLSVAAAAALAMGPQS